MMARGESRKALVIAGVEIRRLVRDRTFVLILLVGPMILVLVLGMAFGGGFTPALGLVAPDGDPFADELVEALENDDDVTVDRYSSERSLRLAVERGSVEAGLVIPEDYAEQLAQGESADVGFFAKPVGFGAQLQTVVLAAAGPQSIRLQAAQFGAMHGTGDFDESYARAVELERDDAMADGQVRVQATTVGDELFPSSMGRFDIGASTQLLLFVFINGLASSVVLIQSRQLGVARRMLSTPTPMGAILVGEALGRLSVTLFQGSYIMVATWLLFGVDWGDPLGAGLVVLLFGLVAAGASMLIGSVFSNAQQVQGVSVLAGLGLAALGGSMAPLEVFSPTMRAIAHVTPHAWGNDAFATLVNDDGGVFDILGELGVLAAAAVVLLSLATWRLHRSLTST